jgi:ribosome recycling factor
MSKEEYKDLKEKMNKTLSVLKGELNGVRAGRANPAILDKISIDYYGTPTPINQLANISVPEAEDIKEKVMRINKKILEGEM